jgi:hypothetical protein
MYTGAGTKIGSHHVPHHSKSGRAEIDGRQASQLNVIAPAGAEQDVEPSPVMILPYIAVRRPCRLECPVRSIVSALLASKALPQCQVYLDPVDLSSRSCVHCYQKDHACTIPI